MPACLLIALAVLSFFAAPAWATFPGRNGDLLLTENVNYHAYPSNTSNLLRISPQTGALARTPVCAVTAAGGSAPGSCHSVGPPAVSPDGRSVAFAGDTFSGSWYFAPSMPLVRVLSLGTGALKPVPIPGETALGGRVRWLPDLGFALARGGQLVRVGPDGSERGEPLTSASQFDVTRGGRFAFVRRGNLWLLRADGGARRLTRRGGNAPSWSPGGRLIAFERGDAVYTLAVRGGSLRRVARGFDPVWSPDGRQVAFLRYAGPRYGDEVAFLYAWSRRTQRVRRVSATQLGVPEPVAPNGLDWAPAPIPAR